MTREEIMAMEAGRLLDSQVGKLVFGNVVMYNPDGAPTETSRFLMVVNGVERPLPRFSTDIAAAWEVVRAVLDLRWAPPDPRHRGGMTDTSILYDPYRGQWECIFSWSDDTRVVGSDAAAPLAICRAALLATLAKEPA